MNRIALVVLVIISIAFASCELDSTAQYTPQIVLSYPVCTHLGNTASDTLAYTLAQDLSYTLDTIGVGDTVRMAALLNAYSNNLTSFTVTWDTSAISLSLDSMHIISKALLPTSQPEQGILYFATAYNYASFPLHYVARKAGVYPILMVLSSDSKFSPSSMKINQPVR